MIRNVGVILFVVLLGTVGGVLLWAAAEPMFDPMLIPTAPAVGPSKAPAPG